jgi:integrase
VLPLPFVRLGELRMMLYADVDLHPAEWRYLVRKTKSPGLVLLARQAVEILRSLEPLPRHLPGGWTFPRGRKRLRPMTNATVKAAMGRLWIHAFACIAAERA